MPRILFFLSRKQNLSLDVLQSQGCYVTAVKSDFFVEELFYYLKNMFLKYSC